VANSEAERRLAAIVFTDIVGYTAIMAESEAKGHSVRARQGEVLRPLVERYGGEWISHVGDETLSSFPSATDAANCALAIQAALRNEPELAVRVGIHLGDIVEREGSVHGDGVNIAARIRPLAEPGGVAISDEVAHAIRNQENFEASSIGEHEFKNVGRPVAVFALGGTAAAPGPRRRPQRRLGAPASIALAAVGLLVVLAWWSQTSGPDRVAGLSGRPAIAVLPFKNLGGDPEQRVFADGLAEDLIVRLGSWRSFPVIARASSFNPELPKDVQEAGRELQAQYVVVGSVRRAQERIRVNVQLIDTASGRNVWASQYDRDFDDVLALQNEITDTIVGEVNPDLLRFESERAMHQDPASLDAWTTAMQGWWQFNQGTRENMMQAVGLFERAAELDPQFGYAYAGLALAHFRSLIFGWTDDPEQTAGAILAAAEKAVALDELGAEAHHALGHAFAVTGQTDRMLGAFALGVEFNPSDAMANNCYGAHLALVGRSEEAIEVVTHAMSISPRDPWAFEYRVSMAWAYFAIPDYEHALEWAERSIERGPNPMALQVAAASAGQLGRTDEARASLRELLRLAPGLSEDGLKTLFGIAKGDFVDRLLDGLRKAGWEA
jgi:TolB-like protein/class 3 adenylate cyclase/Tfp pilus assembly protein PilF